MKKLLEESYITTSDLKRIQSYLPLDEPALFGSHIIPVCEPDLQGKEKEYLLDAFSSSWISGNGSYGERFERLFSQKVSNTKFAISVNSGTSALHVALTACAVRAGDEVIVPTFTMIATANAVRYCGATPVFIDADLESWNIDVTKIEQRITKKTRAIIVVHTYGSPVDMDVVLQLAKKYNLWVIEDAAEAHGAEYKGKRVGSIGDVAAFSLYANKIISAGEGGVVTTNNPKIAERAFALRDHAFTKKRHFWHNYVGFSYKLSNLQAAIALAQVERFTYLFNKRREHALFYSQSLAKVSGLVLPRVYANTKHAFWMYGILVDKNTFGIDKDALRAILAKKGIETRSFFIPIHLQRPYFQTGSLGLFPVAENLGKNGLYLPSASTLSKSDMVFICHAIQSARRVHT